MAASLQAMNLFPLFSLSALLFLHHRSNAQPSPGFYPSSRLKPVPFYHGFTNLWGPQHQWVSGDQSSLTIWLDRNSGSGFKSIRAFRSGYFATSIMLQRGYTAGVITAFYVRKNRAFFRLQNDSFFPFEHRECLFFGQLSNNEAHPGFHDEVDVEFLGTKPGEPYTLQTNVYVRGSGDGRIIGREMKFHLWFDPTAAFHSYAIMWNQREIIFLVDDVPIRRYANWSPATFPQRPMWLYGSIWDASSWATDDGKYRADYRYQPFVAHFTHFVAHGCTAASPASCHPPATSLAGFGLSRPQRAALLWAQRHSLVYDYCRDPKRDHSLTPECRRY